MELDNLSGAPDIAASVEPALERSGVVTGLSVDQNGVHGAPAATKDADDIGMRQRVANVQAEARLPRLVSGPK